MQSIAQEAQEADAIQSAAELLNRLDAAEFSTTKQQTVVLAAAVIAVAVELRRVHNALIDLQETISHD